MLTVSGVSLSPRYPQIHVKVRSHNPLALVGAVRMALRRAGIGPREVHRFSNLAMAHCDSSRLVQICDQWVHVDAPVQGTDAGQRPPAVH